MSATFSPAYVLRWSVFCLRRAAYSAYGVLQFVGKPGSHLIVPALLTAAAVVWREATETVINDRVLHAPWHDMPEPLTMEVLSGVVLVSVLCISAVVWSCLFHLQWVAQTLSGLFGFGVRVAVLLMFGGLGAALYWHLPLDARLLTYLPFGVGQYLPTEPAAYVPHIHWHMSAAEGSALPMHGLLALAVLVLASLYVLASRVMALVLGAFPTFVKPLPPLRPLHVKDTAIRPVVVSIVVPKLPRRRPVRLTEPLPVSNIPEG